VKYKKKIRMISVRMRSGRNACIYNLIRVRKKNLEKKRKNIPRK